MNNSGGLPPAVEICDVSLPGAEPRNAMLCHCAVPLLTSATLLLTRRRRQVATGPHPHLCCHDSIVTLAVYAGTGVGKSRAAQRRSGRASSWQRRRAALEPLACAQQQIQAQQPPRPLCNPHEFHASGTVHRSAQPASCPDSRAPAEALPSERMTRPAVSPAGPTHPNAEQHHCEVYGTHQAAGSQWHSRQAHASMAAGTALAPAQLTEGQVSGGGAVKARRAQSAPQGWLGPQATMIPRGAIFHSASFPRKPGLPSHRAPKTCSRSRFHAQCQSDATSHSLHGK